MPHLIVPNFSASMYASLVCILIFKRSLSTLRGRDYELFCLYFPHEKKFYARKCFIFIDLSVSVCCYACLRKILVDCVKYMT